MSAVQKMVENGCFRKFGFGGCWVSYSLWPELEVGFTLEILSSTSVMEISCILIL